ncbi:MAG: AAA family ATPase [Oscillatoriaceae cyanobacterium Prado104]|jgi:predicted ATPase|nr:AAA family ATPase [Oscillatoriaceae cyanobacterium Prado104]
MLKKIYVNNFRCLVNFELTADSLNLFLGSNGSGKTTVFEVLRKLKKFIAADRAFQQNYKVSEKLSVRVRS